MKKIMKITADVAIAIHNAIHSDAKEVVIDGKTYPIKSGKLRYMDLGDTRFMEQNPNKLTPYAKRAQAGHKITWGMAYPHWLRVEDGIAYIPTDAFAAVEA